MSAPLPRLLTIGETMALVTPTSATPLESAAEFALDSAGAESNLASHCAQLGLASAWVSVLGEDALGRRILTDLASRGVDTRWVREDSSHPTGVYFKDPGAGVLYYRAGSAAASMGPDMLEGLPLASADFLHLTGITPALSESCAALINAAISAAHASGTPVSFDVNYRPALWPVTAAGPALLDLCHRVDYVLVGLDEAEVLWGTTTAQQVRDLIPNQVLVVKNGDVGATEFTATETTFVPAFKVEVVEEIGAGDAFAAGYLTALLNGSGPRSRLAAGHAQAALVLTSTADFVPTPPQPIPSPPREITHARHL